VARLAVDEMGMDPNAALIELPIGTILDGQKMAGSNTSLGGEHPDDQLVDRHNADKEAHSRLGPGQSHGEHSDGRDRVTWGSRHPDRDPPQTEEELMEQQRQGSLLAHKAHFSIVGAANRRVQGLGPREIDRDIVSSV